MFSSLLSCYPACKIKARIEIFKRLHIFWDAISPKGPFFFFFFFDAYVCCGATWKSPLLRFIHLFVSALPPLGLQRFSQRRRQSTVCCISAIEAFWSNSTAIFEAVVSKCGNLTSFREQYHLKEHLQLPDVKKKHSHFRIYQKNVLFCNFHRNNFKAASVYCDFWWFYRIFKR